MDRDDGTIVGCRYRGNESYLIPRDGDAMSLKPLIDLVRHSEKTGEKCDFWYVIEAASKEQAELVIAASDLLRWLKPLASDNQWPGRIKQIDDLLSRFPEIIAAENVAADEVCRRDRGT